jgi:predicted dehydrogenase
MTPLRIIQVGMGGWGRDWAKLQLRHPELVDLVACVDVVPAMLEKLQAETTIAPERCFSSLEAAMAANSAEAVLVTTPLVAHIPVVLAALEAGMHVLVEKPFAPTLAEGQQAVDLASARNLILMVSQNYRFYPAAQTAAALIRAGTLGPVGAVNIQFRKYANTEPRETHWHYGLPHPLLMDMAIHHFDLMRFVLNQEPTMVHCHAWNPPWSNFTDPATAYATIGFNGGTVVQYYGSWVSTAAPTIWAGSWQIECAEGVISWTSRDNTTTSSDRVSVQPRGKRARRVELPATQYWDRAGSLAAFAAAIQQGQTPPTSGRDNLGSLGLMFAAVASAASGQPQKLG